MEDVVFGIGIITGIILLIMYVGSVLWPSHRIWPPGDRNWKFWVHWTVDILYFLSVFILAYLDWGAFVFPDTTSLIVGGTLFVVGGTIALAVELELGFDETLGMEGELKTAGPYRYSRNPQYVGLFIATIGFIFMADSASVTVLGVLRLAAWLILPLPEEAWLRSTYGREYVEYCRDVPRFIGYRSAKRFLTDSRSNRESIDKS